MTLGWMHETGKVEPGDRQLAASYGRAAEIGCLEAYNCLGKILRADGEFVKAREAFKAGAALGNIGSMSWLGTMMLWGQGGSVDTKNAMIWLNTVAEKGHIVATGQLLILERQSSTSIFRHIKYSIKWVSLGIFG